MFALCVEIKETTNNLEFLVTNGSEIWRVEQNGDKHRYSTNTTAVGDVDYHLGKNILFWIDAERREIHSQSLEVNSTSPRVIFGQEKHWQPVAVAVDFINDQIYVADVLGIKVDVFELDGRYHAIAIGTNLAQPLDIKLDPYDGVMFILDGFRIVRANMDGSSLTPVIRQDIRVFRGLSIDLINKKIYWSKATDFEIMSSNYSGENSTSIGKNSSSYFSWTKFAIFNESIYWASDHVQFKANCGPEELGKRRKTIYESNPIPKIKILHPVLQKPMSNPCTNDNGGCQHMCIKASKSDGEKNITYVCACSVGWSLAENAKNCTLAKKFLLYTRPTVLKSYIVENCTGTFCEPYLPISKEKSSISDFDYHFTDNYLYFVLKSPNKYDIIYKVHPNTSKPEIFSVGKNENYQSLSIDWITANLYYTDPEKGTVNVINTRNASQKMILLENLEQPTNIVVHPNKGFIFFLQTNESTKITVLSRAWIDGSNLTNFNEVSLQRFCGFAIDFDEDRIYWYDWRRNYIQHSNLDTTEARNIHSKLTEYPYAISIHGTWIYIVTARSEGLWRFDKKTGEQMELILSDFTNGITKVKVFSNELRKINKEHPCIINIRGCSEFCFGSPHNANGSWTTVCAKSQT